MRRNIRKQNNYVKGHIHFLLLAPLGRNLVNNEVPTKYQPIDGRSQGLHIYFIRNYKFCVFL